MSESRTRPRRGVIGLATILLAVHAFLAWKLRAPAITTGHDDAVYLLLGRGLRDFTYTNYWLVENSPHGLYPPLYPLVLAVTGFFFGDTLMPVQLLNMLFSTLALGILFSVAYRWSPAVAFLTLSVSAVNPLLVQLAGQMYSEPFYLFCTALTLWFLAVPARSRVFRFGAAAASVVSFLARAIGIAMIAAVLVSWLIERRLRAILIFAIASLVFVGGWIAWASLVPDTALTGQSYISDVLDTGFQARPRSDTVAAAAPIGAPAPAPAATASPPLSPPVAASVEPDSNPAPVTPEQRSIGGTRNILTIIPALVFITFKRVISNTSLYLGREVPFVLAFPTIPGTTFDNWLWLVLIAGSGALGLLELGRKLPGAAIYLACYAGILLVWPYGLSRYLAPVIPMMLLAIFLGLGRLVMRRTGRRAWALPAILALVLVVSGLSHNRRALSTMSRCNRTAPFTSEGCFNEVQRGFFEAIWQADREAPRDALFMSPKPATVYFLTGRRSIDNHRAGRLGREELRQHLKDRGVQYILFSRIHSDPEWLDWLSDRLQSLCGEWELRGEYEGGTLLLRRADRQASEPSRATCEAVSRFARGPA